MKNVALVAYCGVARNACAPAPGDAQDQAEDHEQPAFAEYPDVILESHLRAPDVDLLVCPNR